MFTFTKDAMSNATLTTTTVPPTDAEIEELSLNDADKLVLLAFSNLQTAARIYKKEGLTQTAMVERLSALGIKCSERTIQRVFSDLRKQNDPAFQPAALSQKGSAVRVRRHRQALQAANLAGCNTDSSTTVCSQSFHHDQPSHTEPSIRSSVPVVQPFVDTYSDGQDERVVSMGTASDRDWEQAVAHLQALRQFTHDYFDPNGPISEQQWEQFHAECHDLAYFARMRCSNLRQRNEQAAHAILGAVFNDGDSSVQEA